MDHHTRTVSIVKIRDDAGAMASRHVRKSERAQSGSRIRQIRGEDRFRDLGSSGGDHQLARGGSITEGLRAAGGFPVEFLDAVHVGEESGRLSETLEGLSKRYEQQAETRLAVLTMLSGFAVWGLVAMVLIAMIFRLAMFYLGTIQGALDGI